MEILLIIVTGVVGYFLGNVHTSVIYSKYIVKKDIREHGSGSAGATNAFRVLGLKAGILVFIGDVLKGVLAVLIGRLIGGEIGGILAGLMAVVGHNWPVLYRFRGGKGIASTFGMCMVYLPWVGLALFLLFIILVALTKIVSLSSLIAMTLVPISAIVFNQSNWFIGACILLWLLAIFQHRANIGRLIRMEENKIGSKKK